MPRKRASRRTGSAVRRKNRHVQISISGKVPAPTPTESKTAGHGVGRTSRRFSPSTIAIDPQQIAFPRSSLDRLSVVRDEAGKHVQPIVKWAGGKQWLAVAARHLTPPGWKGRYYEPFVGGGSFFFALKPKKATLADTNSELIQTYEALREDPEGVIQLLSSYSYNSAFYYRVRKRKPTRARLVAARFIYLNRSCWNGLYRTNRQGEFNTPFGEFVNPTICDRKRLRAAAVALRPATLLAQDFEKTVCRARQGDFVYFDPPYITGHQNNGFLRYNRHLFSWCDQERLAKVAVRLAEKKVYVLVSNAGHDAVVSLYKGFNYYRVPRRSLISGEPDWRGRTSEALLSSYRLLGRSTEVIE